jgi:hypothetical protein
MILHCNFEELQALGAGVELVLDMERHRAQGESAVAAPAATIAQVEALRTRLGGDLSIETLADQRRVRSAVALITETLRERLEGRVIEFHPAHEEAVANYFDFGHTLAVLHRLDVMGAEMSALIELMTGETPTEDEARTISFADD